MHQPSTPFDQITRTFKIVILSWVILLPAGGSAQTQCGFRLKPELSRCSTMISQRSPGVVFADRSLPTYLQGTDGSTAQGTSRPGFAGRALNDLWYGVKTGVSDLGYIYSSPARIKTRSALLLGGIITIGGVIYFNDREIYDAFKRNQDHQVYKPIREVGEFFEPLGYMGFTNKYYFSALILGYLTGYKPLLYFSLDMLESYFIAGFFKNGANVLVGRRRPAYGEGPYSFKFADGTSFPSGHALNVVQLARVLSYHFRFLPVRITAYGMAASVCLERITSDAHWPSDVYVGAVFGWAVAAEVLKLNSKRRIKVIPLSFEDTVGVKLILQL